MTAPPKRPSLLAQLAGRSTLLLAPLVVIILVLAAIPTRNSVSQRPDPTSAARNFQQSLQERIHARVPGLEILTAAPIDSTDLQMLSRDLFARGHAAPRPDPDGGARAASSASPGSREPAGSPALRPAPAPEPVAPRLEGIVIDGPARRAVLAGHVVTEGETVDGYRVIEITARGVRLERQGVTQDLSLGETP
jgi:hypothetical protein